jgi:DNA end-binding protein Ku
MKVIESKVEGKQLVEPEPVEEGGNLIDLMAALEASVQQAKDARGAKKPVSVSAAKKARAERPARTEKAEREPARAGARTTRGKQTRRETEEARPARRRKSA